MSYAQGTEVPVEKSRFEIERILQKYGATSFGYGWEHGRALIMFTARKRSIRMEMSMPSMNEVKATPTGKRRNVMAQEAEIQRECRRRWRALLLVIKAKLEAVESKIATFEDEFLPYTVLPSGETFGQWAAPQIDEMKASSSMPKMLGPGTPKEQP